VLIGALLTPPRAMGVNTSHWVQQSEADWKAGTFESVVATNLGDLKLSRAVKTLLSQDDRVSSVYAFAQGPDGSIYAGTGPQGVLLRIKGETVSTAQQLGDNVNIFSLLFDDQGRLLIGTGGDKGQVLRLDHPEKPHDKPTEVFSADGVQYVWSMIRSADGTLYAATGPNGQLFQINPDGTHKVLFNCEENNLLSLISDGADKLYVGTDPDGLVYRIDRKTGSAFILYDAQESDIKALALDKQGNLYAATAESGEPAKMNASGSESADRIGRPEKAAAGTPIPSQPPSPPKPPQLPLPGPGEPAPIPRSGNAKPAASHPLSLAIMDDPPATDPGPGVPAPGEPSPPQGPDQTQPDAGAASAPQPATPTDNPQKNPNGNAIYKITPDGFVTEIFREQVAVLSLVERDGILTAGTGSEGVIYEISPAAEETIVAAKLDSKDVTCLFRASDGRLWLGSANSGQIATLGADYASTGTYTSAALDAKQVSRFGKVHLRGSLPKGSTLTVATRSGNIDDPASAGWSPWSAEVPATEFVPVSSPSARFLQYRLTFGSADGKATPVVDSVSTAYQMPNLAPVIRSIKVAPQGKPAGQTDADNNSIPAPAPVKTITWEASDPNNDALQYTLYFRLGSGGDWTLLKDKLTDTSYDWNTRNVADGNYHVKVVASDAAANPIGQGKTASRVSEEIVVDNTPPEIGDIQTTAGKGETRIQARVVDITSTVAALAYSVDSAEDWQAVLPVDTIADSPEEAYSFVVGGLSAGTHQITLRATDSQGNPSYATLKVTVEAPPAKD
jgi:hypothetical protein